MPRAQSAIGALMTEHRLIERMIADMDRELGRLEGGTPVDPAYIGGAVDFLVTYADLCHHGKEEDILFRVLATKELKPDDARMMQELIDDHAWARRTKNELVMATDRHAGGDPEAAAEVRERMSEIVAFYPVHIEKEDHGFFKVAVDCLTREERDDMAAEFREFDRRMIHDEYLRIVEAFEARAQQLG